MDTPKRILVIDDKTMQFRPIREDLVNAGWEVLRAEDEASTMRELALAATAGRPFDAVLLDLGLPPDIDNPLKVGIPLARVLRRELPQTPILAYTSIIPAGGLIDYDRLLAELLPLQISFVYNRKLPDDVTISGLIELISRGFYVLGPGAADFLSAAVADSPDPLEATDWETLAGLGRGRSDSQIAPDLGLSPAGVRNRIGNIRERLVGLDLIPLTDQLDRQALVEWYFANRVRYRHP
jgi:DNA-binding NarL/FixJ family response regulator